MSNEDRVTLGEAIRKQRERQYGTKRNAYNAAGVNAATWDKAEEGVVIRGDRLTAIVKTLWPHTGGDWTAVVGGADQDPAYVAAPGELVTEGRVTNSDLMAELLRQRAEYDQLRAEVRTVSERVARLEHGPKSMDRTDGAS